MNFYALLQKIEWKRPIAGALILSLWSCGPGGQNFSILPASQSTFQGSVANNKVDILWVIDNSGSMAPKQATLAAGFSDFISVFNTKNFDYRMAVVTTDTGVQLGQFQGTVKVIENTTNNMAAEFSTNVNVGAGGSAQAKALDATTLALGTANLAGANANFLRSDAHLAVIYVSDADDNDSTETTATVNTFLAALKPQKFDVIARTYKNNFTVSAVIAPSFPDADCTANYGAGTYEKGTKFINLSALTSGSTASICNASFSTGLTNLSQRIAEAITDIPLSRVPDTSTIVVLFNGTPVTNDATNGWTYSSTGNKIVFHGTAIPTNNTTISINYTPNDIIR